MKEPGAPPLRERLLRGLARERLASEEQLLDVHALPREERIESGHCIDALRFAGWEQNRAVLVLRCQFNVSKFRAGDKLLLGYGDDPRRGAAAVYVSYDPAAQLLRLTKDRWSADKEGWDALDLKRELTLDRTDSDFGESVLQAVRLVFDDPAERFARIRAILEGTAEARIDAGRRARAAAAGARFGLDESQRAAFAEALARSPFHLVQGPPGSGKTRLIAALASTMAAAGERVLVTAYTHRAVNNALRGLHGVDPSLRAVKIGEDHHAEDLPGAVERVRSGRGIVLQGTGGPAVVGATVFALKGFREHAPFEWVVFDEAAQIPIPHAIGGMLAGRRYLFVGDHRQLGPIVVGEHEDTLVERSIFGHLAEHAAAGTGGAPPSFLSRTYRMNAAIAEFPSRHFYDSRLAPSEQSAARRFPAAAGGPFDALWDPARPAVLALIGHAGHRTRCRPEARLAADLIEDYLGRLRLPPEELAVVTPYRAQIREIRNLLKGKGTPAAGAADAGLPLIDSVERMQGQEREAMIVSLVCSEPEYAARGAAFFFSPNRLNVALTRARTKLIVLASPLLFEALPADLAGLRGASLFARLFRELPKVDLSERYLGSTVL